MDADDSLALIYIFEKVKESKKIMQNFQVMFFQKLTMVDLNSVYDKVAREE